MNDFEKWWKREHNMPAEFKLLKDSEGNYVDDQVHNDHEVWQAAIASMKGEAVAWRIEVSREGWKYGNYFYHDKKFESDRHVRLLREDKSLTAIQSPLFTYPPDAAAEIASKDARIAELESQVLSADQLSVHDIRVGMAALLQCEFSEIESMDNRLYDESYQAVQRVIESISLNVKQEKLFGSEIYQAAADNYEKEIARLTKELEEARNGASWKPSEEDYLKWCDRYHFPPSHTTSSQAFDDATSLYLDAIRKIGGGE